ncbi:hypothetical protein QTP86_003596 [Hemibagrus guttatus]|nr:hypothetical protein QTP86_003596 [Hemibagrus guttatus]
MDLQKAYDRVPREELWYCMRKSGVAEKYVRVVQDMYERSRTVVRCAVGQTEEFKVEVGLHQGSALSPFLFTIVMDQLSEEVRQESPWTMMFADDIVICSESREQVEENLERWRFALERRGMKVSRSKTEYMCVNKREGSGTVRLQGEEVKKVQEFKYLGSTVQSNGECGKEVKKRVQAVTRFHIKGAQQVVVGCELEGKERFWSELDEVIESIPTDERVVIGEDFNGHVGEGNRGDEEVMGKFGVKERNLEGQMVVLAEDWETTAEVIRVTGRKVLGVSSGRRKEDKETWWWNEEVQDSIQRKRLAKKKWDMDRTEENRQEYKELQRRVKREVSKAK